MRRIGVCQELERREVERSCGSRVEKGRKRSGLKVREMIESVVREDKSKEKLIKSYIRKVESRRGSRVREKRGKSESKV